MHIILTLGRAAASIWCLGASQVGAEEAAYTRSTVDFPLAAARAMHDANPGMPLFVFRPGHIRPTAVSGARRDLARFLAPVGPGGAIFIEAAPSLNRWPVPGRSAMC